MIMYERLHLLQQKDEEWHKVQVFKMKTWLSFYNNNIDLKLSTLELEGVLLILL